VSTISKRVQVLSPYSLHVFHLCWCQLWNSYYFWGLNHILVLLSPLYFIQYFSSNNYTYLGTLLSYGGLSILPGPSPPFRVNECHTHPIWLPTSTNNTTNSPSKPNQSPHPPILPPESKISIALRKSIHSTYSPTPPFFFELSSHFYFQLFLSSFLVLHFYS